MSSARAPQSQGYPTGPPPPFSVHDPVLEMHDYKFNQPTQVAAHTEPQFTPYLGLRARLSQVWLNRWTVLILLVLVRVLLLVGSIDKDIASAKSEALSACTSVENVGSAMASMPHYMSQGVNELAADGVTAAVNGMMEMLLLTVTGVEEIVLFVINMMTSTYVCLATVVIDGALSSSIELMEDVANSMNKTINGLTSDIASAEGDFQDAFNTFLSGLGDLSGLFGATVDIPKINLTSQINSLNNIQIDPSQFDADLTKLNSSLPSFAQVQNFTNGIIETPFELVKSLINSTMMNYTFDKSVFPVAQKQSLTFCSDNDGINDFFDGLSDVAHVARKVFIIVLVILAILVCIPMAWREIWAWKTMKMRSTLLEKHAFDPMDVLYIASRPYTSSAGIKVAAKAKSTKSQIIIRWFIAYATSLPALFVLAVAVAGLFACLCQYIILKSIEKEVPVLANEVGDFAQTVVNALNNASTAWATGANEVINSTNAEINENVFGWVNTTTSAVNDTLNAFIDQMTIGLNETFGGTILYTPVSELFYCLIGLKVASFEKGLTWVSDHAHITFPEFNNNTFSLGAQAALSNDSSMDSFLASPGSVSSDDVTSAVVAMTHALESAVRQEAIIASMVFLVYVIVVIIGGICAAVMMYSREKTRAEGGAAGYVGDYPVAPAGPSSNAATMPMQQQSMFPQFGGPVKDRSGGDPEEYWMAGGLSHQSMAGTKLGEVRRSVEAAVRPGHQRSSSYGYLADEKR